MTTKQEKNVSIRILPPAYVAQQEVAGKLVDIRTGIMVRGEFVMPGGTCDVLESEANDLIQRGRAELVA